ncbi:hypothetical protein Rvan_2965 [Rhodomicrobium vannielii ATCC 17100]|uniref:Uncharacterized protein n=1 Tax=Rhodomicrobium vannielii (strain ATCC 17100 / DSM 162 / LMG 4299 / NCIMB 10020 / ATH 3.1.1) TaxID=648757 RepID=E3HZQ9_RHOVT|nr:hypothetical protein [Rhodomicrobium vannielii]ADP72169.1 hypothetical protein Rvan_2965 [Rhodomicrobium vannielii ATCC 17100]
MTRASDDLQMALSGLKTAAYAELGVQADAAARAINDLADAVGADIANASDGSPSSFASALELARLAIELDLQGNAFYLASKKLDAVRAFLPASGEEAETAPAEATSEESVVVEAAEAAPSERASAPQPETASEQAAEAPAVAAPAQVAPDEVAVASWEPLTEGPNFDALSAASKTRVEEVAADHGIETVHHHEAPAHLHENVAAAEESASAPKDSAPEPRGVSFDDLAAEAKERVEVVAADHGIETVHHHEAPAHLHENVAAAEESASAPEHSAPEPRSVSFDDLAAEAKERVEEVAADHGIETVHHHEAPAHLHDNVAAAEESASAPEDSAPEPRGVSFDDLAAEAKERVEEVAADHGIETVHHHEAPAHLHDNAVITQDNEPQSSEAAPAYEPAADPSIEGVLQGGGGDALGEAHARVEEIADRLESASAEASQPDAPAEPAETPAAVEAEVSVVAEEPQQEPIAAEVEPEAEPAEQPGDAQPELAETASAESISARDVAEATHDLGSPAEAASEPVQEYGSRETRAEPQPVPVFAATQPSDAAEPAQPQEAAPSQSQAATEPQPVPVYEAAQSREPVQEQPQEPAPAKPAERQSKPQAQKTLFSLWLDMVFGKKK